MTGFVFEAFWVIVNPHLLSLHILHSSLLFSILMLIHVIWTYYRKFRVFVWREGLEPSFVYFKFGLVDVRMQVG